MKHKLSLILGLFVFTAFVGRVCAQSQNQGDPETVQLRVRVKHKDCDINCRGQGGLQLSVLGQAAFGWPAEFDAVRLPWEESDGKWRRYSVPAGSQVAVSVFAPPHPLFEKVVDMGTLETRDLLVELESAGPMVKVDVQVVLPSNDSEYVPSFQTWVIAKETGHKIQHPSFLEPERGLHLPRGEYEIEARGSFPGMCGNGRPIPEGFVPFRMDLDLADGTISTLRPQFGSRLLLHVQHPDLKAGNPNTEPLDSPSDDLRVLVLRQNYKGKIKDLMRARLVSLKDGRIYELTWGWQGLSYVFPWEVFPPNKDVYQIVPVPYGKYELVVRGPRIAEYRQEVKLGPELTTTVRIHPKWASTKD